MAKKENKITAFIAWLVGVLVSLAVGFGMINGSLTLPIWLGGAIVSKIVGWIVVISDLIGAVSVLLGRG